MQKFAALASLLPLVAGHGFISSPTPRKPGSAFEAACGQQPYYQQSSDINGNVQGILQVVGTDFDASKCNLWLCKGFQLADNTANVESYTAGQTVDFKINIAAPHTGYANVSVVKTSSNSIIGSPLIEFSNYASNSGIPANNTAFSVTIPSDLGSECSTAGDCVLQWYWDAPDIDQTYESCVDFTVGGSGSGSGSGSASSTPAATSAAAAVSSAAPVSSAAAATSAAAVATTPLAQEISSQSEAAGVATTPAAPATTPSGSAEDDGEDCDDEGETESTAVASAATPSATDAADDEDCDDEGEADSTAVSSAATPSATDSADDEDCDDEETVTTTVAAASEPTVASAGSSNSGSSGSSGSSSSGSSSSGSSGSNSGSSGSSGSGSAVTSYITVTPDVQTVTVSAAAETQYVTVTVSGNAAACT